LWWLVGWPAPATAVFVTFALGFALLFYPVSRVGFDGLIYRMGGDDQLYGKVTQVTDGDT
jgi:inner membrane protein